jgi:hypothetical protein
MDASEAKEILRSLRRDGKPLIFGNLAVLVAASGNELGEFLKELIGRKASSRLLPIPALDKWSPMYQSYRRMWNALDSIITVPGGEFPLSDERDRGFSLARLPKPERRAALDDVSRECPGALEDIVSLFREVPLPPNYEFLVRLLAENDLNSEEAGADGGRWDEFMLSVEGQFFFRVWLPCWIMYRTYPPLLLW